MRSGFDRHRRQLPPTADLRLIDVGELLRCPCARRHSVQLGAAQRIHGSVRPDVGSCENGNGARARQSRVQQLECLRLLLLFRSCCGESATGILLVQHWCLAHHLPEQRLCLHHRRVCCGRSSGTVAQSRSRGSSQHLHARLLASSALVIRGWWRPEHDDRYLERSLCLPCSNRPLGARPRL